ncbi:MAG: ATP-binding protein [Candidatus Kapabacteria bacterium]|nr:ATP-binding protein [Candidatus Kapabacteria bacterium]
MSMIARPSYLDRIDRIWQSMPCVLLVGPRQSGKTTIARDVVATHGGTLFDAENLEHVAALREPLVTLRPLQGLVVIDEVQHLPDIFRTIRVLVDEPGSDRRFLLLGSASGDLLRQTAESLTGRIGRIEVRGLSVDECGTDGIADLWNRGGLPRSYLATTDAASLEWRREYMRSVIERDIPGLGIRTSSERIMRAWMMLMHSHGDNLNVHELARSLDVAAPTARGIIDLFTDLMLLRQLQPWFENVEKRQRKSPKIYVRDAGLLHAALNIASESDLLVHPKRGASWEGFVIEELIAAHRPDAAYYWATHQGAELDLLLHKGGRRIGFEVKLTSSPSVTQSMRIAMHDLRLDAMYVVYAGTNSFTLEPKVTACSLQDALRMVI